MLFLWGFFFNLREFWLEWSFKNQSTTKWFSLWYFYCRKFFLFLLCYSKVILFKDNTLIHNTIQCLLANHDEYRKKLPLLLAYRGLPLSFKLIHVLYWSKKIFLFNRIFRWMWSWLTLYNIHSCLLKDCLKVNMKIKIFEHWGISYFQGASLIILKAGGFSHPDVQIPNPFCFKR